MYLDKQRQRGDRALISKLIKKKLAGLPTSFLSQWAGPFCEFFALCFIHFSEHVHAGVKFQETLY